MKSLRSIVSQLVDLTHSLCYWNTTRGALHLADAERLGNLFSQPVEYTLQELASVVWRFDLCISQSRSRSRPLYEKTARSLHLIHDCSGNEELVHSLDLICPRRWTGKLDLTWCWGDEKSFVWLSQQPPKRQRANGIVEMNSLREKKRRSELICTLAAASHHLLPYFLLLSVYLEMRGSECQFERCDKIKESLQTHVWPNQGYTLNEHTILFNYSQEEQDELIEFLTLLALIKVLSKLKWACI